jgi:hypothetical protein
MTGSGNHPGGDHHPDSSAVIRSPCCLPPWTEQVEMVVLRFTADDVVAMAAD